MSPPDDSPADELERQLSRERADARGSVKLHVAVAMTLQALAAVLLYGGVLVPTADFGLGVLILLCWGVSVIVAAGAGVITFRRWSLLSGWWIAFGLLPWVLVATEISVPVLAILLSL